MRQFDRLLLVIGGLGLLLMCLGRSGEMRTAVSLNSAPIPPFEPDHYGLVYFYPHTAWTPDDYDDMVAALANAKASGIDTLLQTFSASLIGSPNAHFWRLFLDAAAQTDVKIIAYLWPRTTGPDGDGNFQYAELKAFLDVVGDHPALLGYIGLHEPLEPPLGITGDELRGFYTEMKSYAPHLKIAHYMGNMAYAEEHRTDGWQFSDGMCDICIIWYYPFSVINGQPVYEAANVPPVVVPNVALVRERDPDAELWFLGQTFTAAGSYPRTLRMPTAAEMEALYCLVMESPVDGFLWYPWNHTVVYDEVLGDPEMAEQQDKVGEIDRAYRHRHPLFLPLIGK